MWPLILWLAPFFRRKHANQMVWGTYDLLSMYINTWRAGAKRTKPDSSQWCLVTGPEAMGTKWKIGGSLWTSGNALLTVRLTKHWHRLPRKVVESLSLKVFKAIWTRSWGTGSRWPCSSSRDGPDVLQTSLPTSTCLWFWDSVPVMYNTLFPFVTKMIHSSQS